jgi:hypothetical protein
METLDMQGTDKPKTLSVPDAGRIYFDMGRNASYAAAALGQLPTIKIGSRLRCPVVALERMMEQTEAVHAKES